MAICGDGHARSEAQMTLGPIVGLTKDLPKSVLEAIVIEAIRRHRFLRDIAEIRHEEAGRYPARDDTVGPERVAYISAMIDVHAQQTVLSTLLEVLGYVPEVAAD
ncbi:MAG: transcriptional regulator [Bacteroidales bacterium]|nr:transcriptional regulator [Bacteroidales bacterium]